MQIHILVNITGKVQSRWKSVMLPKCYSWYCCSLSLWAREPFQMNASQVHKLEEQ